MPTVIIDPDSKSLQERFAVIKTPRRNRKRFPVGIVEIVGSRDSALETAAAASSLHPAIVYGPSTSSESQKIYYLVRWLDE